jgi:outer membrane protein OmpA-like peptidoglycan-associated protein
MALAAFALLLAAGSAGAQTAPPDGAKEPVRPGDFSLRTNLLYDALLVPSLGFEWRVSDEWGVMVNGAWSYWCTHSAHRIQDVWIVNPEVRRYMGGRKRFYVGLAGSVGSYNLHNLGLIGKMLPQKNTGYHGDFWNAGAVAGYQMKLADAFSLDLNIGLGYNSYEHTRYTVVEKGLLTYTKTLGEGGRGRFGPTQAGVTLAWHFGKPKRKAAPAPAPAPVVEQPRPAPQPQPESAPAPAPRPEPKPAPTPAPAPQPELVMITVGDLLFDFDKAELRPEGRAELARAATWLRQHAQVSAAVEGHTDNYGGDGYNQRLSEARAKAVYDYLVSEGVAASRLSHRGYGESRPVAGNDTAGGRARNRRVEIRLVK